MLLLSQLREQPGRLIVTTLAIALGVALGAAVYLVNTAALDEFGLATKKLVGEADVVVRGPREGFPDAVFAGLVKDPSVAVASPVLELDVALPARRDTLKVLGLDSFRAAALQPALIGDLAGSVLELLQPNTIFLSSSAARELNLQAGDSLPVIVGSKSTRLKVLGVLAEATYSQPLGIMDIASAQWVFDCIGRLNRIDLRLVAGSGVDAFRNRIAPQLPAGVLALAPAVERDRAVTVTRAYRVNLNMLALVALWTGAFLVFSTQSLSVLRRRRSLSLLRALGVTRDELQYALIGEGAAIGAAGGLLGILIGLSLAAALLRLLTGDLGNGQLHVASAILHPALPPMVAFLCIGIVVASLGAWLPARAAARQPPARALKGGDGQFSGAVRASWKIGVGLLLAGCALARLPAVGGLPVFGYLSIAALLFGAVMLVPKLTATALRLVPRSGQPVLDNAIAQLKENVSLSSLSLASIIVSFSLMVAMAIMVYSFRLSFDHWLGKLLPADLQLRVPFGNDTAYWSVDDQLQLTGAAGVARIEFRRTRQILLDPTRPAVTLIARGATAAQLLEALPLVQRPTAPLPTASPAAFVSEAMRDIYGYQLGNAIDLPVAGHRLRCVIAGIWRDYARTFGAVVISRDAYVAATQDRTATEGSVWLQDGADPGTVEDALRARLPRAGSLEILTSTALRERSLQIFDRAFAITYALELIAVVIGLTGVSFAASSTALARRSEFGMLRHIGMQRRQVLRMLASEGVLTSLFGVVYGMLLGTGLSLVLVFVVNRQSFNWSIDLAIPYWQLGTLSLLLIAAAALTAIWSGRAATSQAAVQAVREDW